MMIYTVQIEGDGEDIMYAEGFTLNRYLNYSPRANFWPWDSPNVLVVF